MADVGHAEERALAWVLGELRKKKWPAASDGPVVRRAPTKGGWG